jgi:RNA polymerase sigma factor (TIGR02999 family)
MAEATQILHAIDAGDPNAASQLFPLVYEELRRLAGSQMAQEKPGHTLTATALVHEAYMRLVGDQRFENRRHFFAAAAEAEAMRRILVENARRKSRLKRGGDGQRIALDDQFLAEQGNQPRGGGPDELLALNDALEVLAGEDAAAAEIAKLHVFGGVSIEQVGELLGLSRAAAYRHWSYARAWLRCQLTGESKSK